MISISRETQNSSKHSSLWMNSIKGKKAIKPYSNHSVSHIFARAKICRMRTPRWGRQPTSEMGVAKANRILRDRVQPHHQKRSKSLQEIFCMIFKWAVTQQPWLFFIRICTTCLVTYFHWNCLIICFLFCKSWLHRK